MNDPSQVFAAAKHGSQPGIRILKGEAAEDENDKTREQEPVLHSLIKTQTHDRPRLTFPRRNLTTPNQCVVKYHAADHEDDQRNVDPAHDPSPNRTDVSSAVFSYQLGRQMNPAGSKVHARTDMALTARLRQIVGADHRFRIR